MEETLRTLRSLLFVPGNREKLIDKAKAIAADAIILDLEDSVPPDEKESARALIRASIESVAQNHEVFVRVNSVSTPFLDSDLRAVVTKGLAGIIPPKVESPEELKKVATMIEAQERDAGLTAGSVKLLPLIETAKGILKASKIATASPHLIGISFGAEDFTLDMGIERTREGSELGYARSVIALACRAADVMAVDTVYSHFRDTEGLMKEARLVRQMGFQGKLVLHPDQVEPVNRIFSPSDEEVAKARKVVEAFNAALKQGSAVAVLDSRMIDPPVAERARKTIALAERIAKKQGASS
jgi:citrate lyase subunit beta/citryl-CoA lyase